MMQGRTRSAGTAYFVTSTVTCEMWPLNFNVNLPRASRLLATMLVCCSPLMKPHAPGRKTIAFGKRCGTARELELAVANVYPCRRFQLTWHSVSAHQHPASSKPSS